MGEVNETVMCLLRMRLTISWGDIHAMATCLVKYSPERGLRSCILFILVSSRPSTIIVNTIRV